MGLLYLYIKIAQILNTRLPFHFERLISRGLRHLLPLLRLILMYYLK